MADAAVTFLLDNVRKLLVEQVNLISGAEKELKTLQNELELMKTFLLMEKANQWGKLDLFIQFERQIREAVHEAENTLDTCLMQKAKGSGRLGLKNLDLAKKVKKLIEELQPMFQRAMSNLNALPMVRESATSSSTKGGTSDDILKKTQSLRKDNVVGLEDQEATIIKYLNQQTEELDVISIVGMPGLGKTTLAWKIYNNTEIQEEFSPLIWVYVSQKFNARNVFLTILKKLTPQDMSTKDNQELARLVMSHLDKGRFLLFMDAVWTVGDWKQIEAVLPKKNKLGKVLITSRHTRVAKQANRSREPYKLRFLTIKESWELLRIEVFGNNCTPQDLEGLGTIIATQCGGVPLTVIVIGGFLVEKCFNRRDLWEKASYNVSKHLWADEQNRIGKMISLSYDKMPRELRDCFLYLGMFPKDTEISAWKLTRLWIAEGFIQQIRGTSLEEEAEDKLNDLVAMNLIMVEKTKANGDVKTCRVHDLIREFCQNEAAFSNKNLFQEVKKTRQGVFDPSISEIVKCRRLCIHSNVVEFLQKNPKGPDVRSFVCFANETIILPTEYTPLIPEAFDLLRVIDMNPIKFTKFPLKLTKLVNLRYIALSSNDFKSLPKAVSKLWNLQTVQIDTTLHEFEIKVDISKMMQLRHFKTKAAIRLKELKGEGGENLQTLSRLSIECCKEELFNRASNLKNLGIRGNLTNFVNANYLVKLERLEKLKLVHDVLPTTVGNPLHRVPDQHSFPPNLRILTLSSTYLAWQHMTTLGSLDNLEVLKLKEMAFKGNVWEARGGGFLRLESLHIARTDLKTWTATGDPFPKLKKLILKNCEKLQEIPSILEGVLQLVDPEHFSPKLVRIAKKMEAEKQQMQGGHLRTKRGGSNLIMSSGDASASTSSTPN